MKKLERFLKKVEKKDGCWGWKFSTTSAGYGQIQINKKHFLAHRLSYELHIGEIPKGMLVCHTCDNPQCTNPAHLFLGTPKVNQEDMWRKGRGNPPLGERQWLSKLKKEDVLRIRELYKTRQYSQKLLGEMFGVGQSNISYVLNKTWKHQHA